MSATVTTHGREATAVDWESVRTLRAPCQCRAIGYTEREIKRCSDYGYACDGELLNVEDVATCEECVKEQLATGICSGCGRVLCDEHGSDRSHHSWDCRRCL